MRHFPPPPQHSHRRRRLIFPGQIEQALCSTFSRRKCPVPPKSFPPMERTTTTSCRTADPTSFLTGRIRCEGSAPSGKKPRDVAFDSILRGRERAGMCAKTPAQNIVLPVGLDSPSPPTARRCMLRSPRLFPPPLSSPALLSCQLSLARSYVSEHGGASSLPTYSP